MRFSFKSLVVKLSLVCVLTMSANVGQALAENYYVAASNGNDGNRGTLQAPFKTLERGVSVLLPGDTLYVRGGTYQGFYFSLKIPSGNSWDQPVTLKAYQQEKVVLAAPWGKTPLQFNSGREYIIVDGFTIDAKNGDAGIGTGSNSHHIRVMNGEVMNASKSSVITHSGSHAFEFINLRIHDGKGHGIYLATSSHLVKDCSIYRHSGWGVHIYSGGGEKPSHNRIMNNKVYDNARSGRGAGIGLYSGSENSAINNLVWGSHVTGIDVNYSGPQNVFNNTVYNGIYGIMLGDRSSGAMLFNNIISSGSSHGLVIAKNHKNAQIKNNLIYGSGTRDFMNHASTTTQSKNLIGNTYNPKFQNVGGLDLHLQNGSPAIDAGLELSEVEFDFDYNSRTNGSSHDIGAFERS